MPYATLQNLLDRYGQKMLVQLTDRAVPATGAVDDDVVDRALADTDALIDGHLMGRYVLPLAAVPALLTDVAQQVAIYKLHRKAADEKIATDYRDALATLKQIAMGGVRLNVAGVEPAPGSAADVRVTAADRPLTNDSLKGFI